MKIDRGGWIAAGVLLLSLGCDLAGRAPSTSDGSCYGCEPHPRLSPMEVVRIQVEALRHANEPRPNAGIWTTYRFTSPANHKVTGPYGRFLQMIKTPRNRAFLRAGSARVEPVRITDQYAGVRVVLTGEDGRASSYLFSLSKQTEGRYKDCWMTDSVAPADSE